MKFERARSDWQIESRVKEIIDCAIKIYEEHGVERLNFLEISKITNFTRPTIYKYFKTKEEIMLALILHYMNELVKRIIDSIGTDCTKEDLAHALTNGFSRSPEFMALYSILYTTIEKNVSLSALVKYKKCIDELLAPLSNSIGVALKCEDSAKISRFLLRSLSFAVGFYPMCHLSDIQKEAKQKLDADYIPLDFHDMFKQTLLLCLGEFE